MMFGTALRYPGLESLRFVLRLGEPLIVLLCSIIAYHMREGIPVTTQTAPMALTVLGVILFTFVAGSLRLYDASAMRSLITSGPRMCIALFSTFGTMLLLLFMFKISAEFSRIWLSFWLLFSLLSLGLLRWWASQTVQKKFQDGFWKRKIVFLGTNERAAGIVKLIQESADSNLLVSAVYSLEDTPKPKANNPLSPLYAGDFEQLLLDGRAGKFDDVAIAEGIRDELETAQLVNRLQVLAINAFYCLPLSLSVRMGVDGLPLVLVFKKPLEGHSVWLKRILDICASGTILLLISPIMLMLAAAVKISSPGPVFFRQQRGGFNDTNFEMLKFRSMRTGAENMRDANGKELQAGKNDPRVTFIGRILRKSSMDELPQLINVLRGDMSLVGPRPHVPSHNSYYENLIDSYASRHKMKPGLTGWAQLNGWRGETETLDKMAKRVEYDIWYTENWSLWLDIKIIFLTPFVTLFQRHAY